MYVFWCVLGHGDELGELHAYFLCCGFGVYGFSVVFSCGFGAFRGEFGCVLVECGWYWDACKVEWGIDECGDVLDCFFEGA